MEDGIQRPPANSIGPFMTSWLARCLTSLRALLSTVSVRRKERNLRVCETLPLGEKRFLAIVQIEGRRFLIGATNQSISLLDRLDGRSRPHAQEQSVAESNRLRGLN